MISKLTAPLDSIRNCTNLTSIWNNEHKMAFNKLKKILPECPILNFPNWDEPFYVATDASNVGIGAVLYQINNSNNINTNRYISFQARALTKSERNYSATKRELLAIIFALKKFHYYLWGRKFTLFTDHAALVYLHAQKNLNPMLTGWYESLFDYDFVVYHRPGITNILPDHLSRFFNDDLEGENIHEIESLEIKEPFLNEAKINKVILKDDKNYIEPNELEKTTLIENFHNLGHFGINATINAIRDKGYNWKNLREDVIKVCKNCLLCLRFNPAPTQYHQLNTICAYQPFDHVAVDLAGPFTTSKNNNHYIHIMVDIHSRFVLIKPIENKKAETIARVWNDIFTTFGYPKIIQSDNGREFVNTITKELVKNCKIDQRLITPYHPRANGAAERTVQTILRIVNKLIIGKKKDWDIMLPVAQYAINQKISERHQNSPFYAMFGRKANEFYDFSQIVIPENDQPTEEEHVNFIKQIEEEIKIMNDLVFTRTNEETEKYNENLKIKFNQSHKIIELPINSMVMIKDKQRKSKSDPVNEGPFKIVAKSTNGSYTLEDLEGTLLPRNYVMSSLIPLSDNPLENAESYEIEAITNHRVNNGLTEYLIKWKNYDESTWEPEMNIDDLSTIHQYWNKRK